MQLRRDRPRGRKASLHSPASEPGRGGQTTNRAAPTPSTTPHPTPSTTRAGDTLAAMLKLLKRDKVLAYKQMFLMYPMHKDEEVTLINPDYVVE